MTKKLTRIFGLLVFILALSFGTSCKKKETPTDDSITKYSEIATINYKEVLSKNGTYYVFIMGNTCTACEELEETLCQYATLAKKSPNSYYPLYCLNSDDTENNGAIIVKGEDGKDADDLYPNFQGTKNYEDIKISTTPGLLVVENGRVTKLISTKTTEEPKTEIKTFFEKFTK